MQREKKHKGTKGQKENRIKTEKKFLLITFNVKSIPMCFTYNFIKLVEKTRKAEENAVRIC